MQQETKIQIEEQSYKQKWHSLARNIPDIVMTVTRDGIIQAINRTVAGLAPAEVIGRNIAEFENPNDSFIRHRVFSKVFQSGQISSYEIRGAGPNGREAWYETRIVPLQEKGKITAAMLICRDITAHKLTEERLQQSEKRYRIINDHTTDGIAITTFGPNPVYTYLSPSVKKMTGYEPEELTGKAAFNFIHPEDKSKLLPILKKYLNIKIKGFFTGEPTTFSELLEFRFRHKSGRWIHVESRADLAGKDTILFVTRDITERRQAEERIALESKSQRVRAEIAQLSMADIGEDEIINRSLALLGTLLQVSRVCLQLVDENGKVATTDYEWKDKGIRSSLGAKFKLKEGGWITEAFMKGKVVKVDISQIRKVPRIGRIAMQLQGVKSFFGVTFHLYGKPAGFFSLDECRRERLWKDEEITLFKDAAKLIELIIERKRAQNKLVTSERMASLGRIAAGVAHELNNPLTGVLGMAELMLEEAGHKTPQKEALEIIKDSALRCKNIITNLLSFSQNRLPEFKTTDIKECLDQSLRLMKKQLAGKDIRVALDISPDLRPVQADAGQLSQVFINLISNAVDACRLKGTLKIKAQMEAKGKSVVLTFEDNGLGITAGHLPHVFEPFFTTKDKQKGTGLGLSITYGIIKAHGGTIECQSSKGKGTSFILSIPLKQGERNGTG